MEQHRTSDEDGLPEPLPSYQGSTRRGLARNVLTGYITTAVGGLIGIVATPLLIRYLGNVQFGLWTMLASLMVYVGLLELLMSR